MTKIIIIISMLFIYNVSSLWAADNSIWAGPTRDNIYPEKNLADSWPDDGPELLWQFDSLGIGYSAVAVNSSGVYVTGMKEDRTGHLYAFNHDGSIKWSIPYGNEWHRGFPGTRSTPVIYEGLMYFESAQGMVFCIKPENGEIVWSKDLMSDYGGVNIQYGLSESILVDDDRVICTPGGSEHNLMALNRLTGEVIWTNSAKGEPPTYLTPSLIERNGTKFLVTMTSSSIMGIDFESGELLWSHLFINGGETFPNTPIYRDGFIYCVAGYRMGGIMLQLSPDNRDVKEIWRNATLDNQMGGVIVLDGYIYGSGHMSDPAWQCLNWQTGEVIYRSEEIGKGAILYADGKFYCYSEDGTVSLVKADSKSFDVINKFQITAGTNEHFAHHIIHGENLYVRHGDSLMVYKIN